jgi:hypothetical protein
MTLLHPGIERFDTWWYARDPTHLAFYSARTMDWIAQRWGFRVLFRDDRNITIFGN